MSTLVFYSNKDTKGLHDATGAFIPEAEAFCKIHNVPESTQYAVDTLRPFGIRRTSVLAVINSQPEKSVDAIAIFGHGWVDGIQIGFTRKKIDLLCDALEPVCKPNLKIALYCCWTAENDVVDTSKDIGPATDGGFADKLRDALSVRGINAGWVDGHKKPGHTTENPFVVRFRCSDVLGIGGRWLVEPGSEHWNEWVHDLKKSDLRYRFPFMTEGEIQQALDFSGKPSIN
jgi:hypothetical protein